MTDKDSQIGEFIGQKGKILEGLNKEYQEKYKVKETRLSELKGLIDSINKKLAGSEFPSFNSYINRVINSPFLKNELKKNKYQSYKQLIGDLNSIKKSKLKRFTKNEKALLWTYFFFTIENIEITSNFFSDQISFFDMNKFSKIESAYLLFKDLSVSYEQLILIIEKYLKEIKEINGNEEVMELLTDPNNEDNLSKALITLLDQNLEEFNERLPFLKQQYEELKKRNIPDIYTYYYEEKKSDKELEKKFSSEVQRKYITIIKENMRKISDNVPISRRELLIIGISAVACLFLMGALIKMLMLFSQRVQQSHREKTVQGSNNQQSTVIDSNNPYGARASSYSYSVPYSELMHLSVSNKKSKSERYKFFTDKKNATVTINKPLPIGLYIPGTYFNEFDGRWDWKGERPETKRIKSIQDLITLAKINPDNIEIEQKEIAKINNKFYPLLLPAQCFFSRKTLEFFIQSGHQLFKDQRGRFYLDCSNKQIITKFFIDFFPEGAPRMDDLGFSIFDPYLDYNAKEKLNYNLTPFQSRNGLFYPLYSLKGKDRFFENLPADIIALKNLGRQTILKHIIAAASNSFSDIVKQKELTQKGYYYPSDDSTDYMLNEYKRTKNTLFGFLSTIPFADCDVANTELAMRLRQKPWKVPTRLGVGIATNSTHLSLGSTGHGWAEALIDGRWVVLDGTPLVKKSYEGISKPFSKNEIMDGSSEYNSLVKYYEVSYGNTEGPVESFCFYSTSEYEIEEGRPAIEVWYHTIKHPIRVSNGNLFFFSKRDLYFNENGVWRYKNSTYSRNNTYYQYYNINLHRREGTKNIKNINESRIVSINEGGLAQQVKESLDKWKKIMLQDTSSRYYNPRRFNSYFQQIKKIEILGFQISLNQNQPAFEFNLQQ